MFLRFSLIFAVQRKRQVQTQSFVATEPIPNIWQKHL